MRIKELIEELEYLLKKHGDVRVVLDDFQGEVNQVFYKVIKEGVVVFSNKDKVLVRK